MKTWCMLLMLSLVGVSSTQAAISQSQADRLRHAADVVASLRTMPDSNIPDEVWNRAECVAVFPDVKKAAFIFGGEYGKGVMTCRVGNSWSAPLFMQLGKGSWGFQVGAEEIDLVLLAMNRRGIEKLLKNKVSLGADASVAAGPVGRTAHAGTDLQFSAEILSYSKSRGLFAGVDVSGGVLAPDNDANRDVYGRTLTARQILFDATVKPPAAAQPFMAAMRSEGGPTATSGRR